MTLVSVVQTYDESLQVTPEMREQLQREAKERAKKAAKPNGKGEVTVNTVPKTARNVTPTVKNVDKAQTPVVKVLLSAGFAFIQSQNGADGYQHKDGRAAIVQPHTKRGKHDSWVLAYPNGSKEEGTDVDELKALLEMKKGEEALKLAAEPSDPTKPVNKVNAPKPPKEEPPVVIEVPAVEEPPKPIAGTPGNVVRAVEILGGLTRMSFDLTSLFDDKKHYAHRMRLMKALLKTERVLVKDIQPKVFVSTFYSAVGAAGDTVPQRQTSFVEHCKKIMVTSMKEKRAAKKADAELVARGMRATVVERTVPGTILPAAPKKTRRQQREELDSTRREVLALAVTKDPIPVPKSDVDIAIVATDVRLLEDPENGLAMLQIERENSQGAICVYNNGTRVACGVVSTDKLSKLRPSRFNDNVSLIAAANQLLSPIIAGVPVTPMAQRHLTAVLNCKELKPMSPETTVAKTRKFESVKKSTTAKKPRGKAEKKPKAAKAKNESAPRGPRVDEAATIKATYKTDPYRAGSARMKLLEIAAKAGTVGAYIKKAGQPTGGSAMAYLGLFVRAGHVKIG